MKFFSSKNAKKSGFVPFLGTAHVNAQRHLRGVGKQISQREMQSNVSYMMRINHEYTGSRFASPGTRDQLEIFFRGSQRSGW